MLSPGSAKPLSGSQAAAPMPSGERKGCARTTPWASSASVGTPIWRMRATFSARAGARAGGTMKRKPFRRNPLWPPTTSAQWLCILQLSTAKYAS